MKNQSFVSNIRSIAYNAGSQQLEVRLHAGAIHRYYGVPNEVYQELAAAAAQEEYIARCIKPRFLCRKQITV